MATDDTGPADGADGSGADAAGIPETGSRAESDGAGGEGRRAGAAADRTEEADVVEEFDERLVDLLAWLLDTETKARIFVRLRQRPGSTSEEIADGTGLYPSTVREALAELHGEGVVTRTKRESSGAGNNPYEYEAIPPADLVEGVAGRVQSELNTVFNLDRRLGRTGGAERDPVTVTVDGTADAGERADGGSDAPRERDAEGAAPDGRPDAE
ncbi:helix-turn-helix domain-containing protein [Candidatus Halobonum tyrrellensis]|uniref:Sugar-specific transcriptional regulator trmb n=1 Tax=Candidatus Halobonum tyrrellensis G22 TaxID=1324957 RepID=V4HI92_9EURY|nr:helix-turn-helix domain-containing protein [Candidatus Halobonum tyrrellensis]ESP89483.1 sugar-specific transcriptional regulator trmb [Candidatus Halobonum tyrrellensis G22]